MTMSDCTVPDGPQIFVDPLAFPLAPPKGWYFCFLVEYHKKFGWLWKLFFYGVQRMNANFEMKQLLFYL